MGHSCNIVAFLAFLSGSTGRCEGIGVGGNWRVASDICSTAVAVCDLRVSLPEVLRMYRACSYLVWYCLQPDVLNTRSIVSSRAVSPRGWSSVGIEKVC